MCLAVPGKVLTTAGADLDRTGRVSFGGVVREVSLAYVPEAEPGDYVIVHVGFALSRLDEAEAARVFEHLRDHGDFPEQNDLESPDRMLGRKELADRIRVALDLLPFDQKTALVLREIDGLSYDEIGYSLGIAVGTVKSRLARAREALRSQLRDV